MSDATTPVAALKENMRRFAEARGWEPYHSPKNLVMALASEVGELCTVFRWLTADESRRLGKRLGQVAAFVGDALGRPQARSSSGPAVSG